MTSWLQLDPASAVPLYLQISEQVRRMVAIGALEPGDRLPTVRELAAQVRVNRNTAARAVRLLESEGVVRTRVGQGTFVADGSRAVASQERSRIVEAAIDRLLAEADAVGVGPDELEPRLAERLARARRVEPGRTVPEGEQT